jgi:hypothetical protein
LQFVPEGRGYVACLSHDYYRNAKYALQSKHSHGSHAKKHTLDLLVVFF